MVFSAPSLSLLALHSLSHISQLPASFFFFVFHSSESNPARSIPSSPVSDLFFSVRNKQRFPISAFTLLQIDGYSRRPPDPFIVLAIPGHYSAKHFALLLRSLPPSQITHRAEDHKYVIGRALRPSVRPSE